MRAKSALLVTVLIAASLVGVKAAQADTLNVPKTSMPVCSATRTDYCVESVTLTTPGTSPQQLTFQAYGAAAPVAPTPTPTPVASGDVRTGDVRTDSVRVPAVDPYVDTTDAGAVAAGIWTTPTWVEDGHSALGYAGIVVDAKAVNAFSNNLYIQVKPGKVDATNKTTYALKKGTTNTADLSLDDIVTVKLRVQNFQSGVTMGFANNVSVVRGGTTAANTITISAAAVPLAMAKNTKDCDGETGVAGYTYNGLNVFIAAVNDSTMGFGIDGVSGNMVVETNGICSASTPVWDETSKSMTWVAAAPHFGSDGTTINQGAYKAIIPVADAKLLWGLTNPNDAATALTVSMTSDATSGGDVNSVKSIAVKNGNIIISSTGYQYSKPKFTVALNPKYKPSTGASGSSSNSGSNNGSTSVGNTKKVTITCVKGKATKKVTAVSPKCPVGYKKKA